MKRWKSLGLGMLLGCLIFGQQPVTADATARAELLGKLQELNHGTHTQEEWLAVHNQLLTEAATAKRAGDLEELLEWKLLESSIQRDMRRNPEGSLNILNGLFDKYNGLPLENFKKVYLEKAQTLSVLGQNKAIVSLIATFKESPYLDEQQYDADGGSSPADPIVLERPTAGTGASITVTAMEKYLRNTQLAEGKMFPDFKVMDQHGKELSRSALAGKVVLLDFWVKDWPLWQDDIPTLQKVSKEYADKGVVIIGFNLDRDRKQAERKVRKSNLSWSHVFNAQSWAGALGVYGEADNFLLNREGQIVGRGLHGQKLIDAIESNL